MPSSGETNQTPKACAWPYILGFFFFCGTYLLPSSSTLHERTGFREVGPCGAPILASLHIPVSVVGNRKNRWLSGKGTDLLSTRQRKPYDVYGEIALEGNSWEGEWLHYLCEVATTEWNFTSAIYMEFIHTVYMYLYTAYMYLYAVIYTACRLLCPWDSLGKNTGVDSIPSSRGSSQPRDWTHVSYISLAGRLLTTSTTWESTILYGVHKCL